MRPSGRAEAPHDTLIGSRSLLMELVYQIADIFVHALIGASALPDGRIVELLHEPLSNMTGQTFGRQRGAETALPLTLRPHFREDLPGLAPEDGLLLGNAADQKIHQVPQLTQIEDVYKRQLP